MRLIQATVPPTAFDDVQRVLDEQNINYFATEETGNEKYDSVLYVSTSEGAVESVLEDLYAAGLDSEDHVVLIDTEVDIFGRADDVETSPEGYSRIASAELEGKTEDLIPDFWTFVTMMVLSTIVATTGVLLDSPAVVVGSMVLAPLFGPAISASVGTVIDDRNLWTRGIKLQVLGIILAVAGASLFASLMKVTYLLPSGFALTAAPQVAARLSPDLLSLVVALVAGVAGVISIATGGGRALVGVMMAAALLPPAAVIGIGIAWGESMVAIHSAILLVVNLLAINFASLVTLWYIGYRPQSWIQVPRTRRDFLKRGGTLFVAILLTTVLLWNVTYAGAQRSQMETAIEEDIQELLTEAAYADVNVVNVKVEQSRGLLSPKVERVTITITRPPGDRNVRLHQAINSRVEQRVGHEVPVDIQVTLVITR